MASGVKSWDTTAANNDDADSTINWLEGQAPSTVNDSARAMMAAIAAWRDNIGFGTVTNATVGGTANAITLTTSPTIEARTAGRRYLFKYTSTGVTGATTLAVDALSAAAVQYLGSALVSGDIATNDWVLVVDDGTNFQLLSKPRISTYSIAGLTEDATGATGDFFLTYDVSTSLAKKLLFSTYQTLFKATEAQVEAETSDALFLTPLRGKNLRGAAKAWLNYETIGGQAIVAGYNVASVTDDGVGDTIIAYTTAMSGNSYAFSNGVKADGAETTAGWVSLEDDITHMAAASLRVTAHGGGGTPFDSDLLSITVHADL